MHKPGQKPGALWCSVSAAALLAGSVAYAGEPVSGQMLAANQMLAAASDPNSGVFNLGQIEQVRITASPSSQTIGESRINRDDIYKFNALTVDRALDLAPGVVSGQTGGARNERIFFVRGFDRFQAPIFVDGIRVYLPADNRFDIGVFPTGNIAQIQVAKGYVSVLSGPGSIGGAINIVTRKPTEPFEVETSAGAQFGMNGYNGFNTSALVGGNDGKVYWQASGAYTKIDSYSVSESFRPVPSENGGRRDNSDNRSYSVNLKLGITPRGNDEYSINYTGNFGARGAPLSVNDSVATQRNWEWPYANIQSLYFLSNTGIGNTAYVKTRVNFNSFRNALYSYDDANYTAQTTTRAFRSYYSDRGVGASIEAGNDFGRDILKAAFFFRHDTHRETQDLFRPVFREPWQTSQETTYSFAGENRFHLTDQLDFVAGASYDWRILTSAEEWTGPTVNNQNRVTPGNTVVFPLANGNALNGQAALIYNYSDTGHVYANVSDRARFPTLMERFSTRFGSTVSNPGLRPERAINYEIGGGETFFENTRVDGAVFYSDFTNGLSNVPILFCDTTNPANPKTCTSNGVPGITTATTQTQNVGNGKFYGFELAVDSRVWEELTVGTRFTFINRHLDAQNPLNPPLPPTFHMTGVPNSQLMAYATYNILPNVSITPNILLDSSRWSNQSSNMNVYIQTGAFFLLNLQVNWQITDRIDLLAGARNLTDTNYQITAGFPNEGRSFFMNLRFRS